MSDHHRAFDGIPFVAASVISLLASCVIFGMVFVLCWWLDDSSTRGTRDLILNGVYPWPRFFSRWAGMAMFAMMAAQFAIYAIVAIGLRRSGMKGAYCGSIVAGFHFFGILLLLA